MTDLSDIDRELDDLGAPRTDVASLVARYGEQDRSLAHIDDALIALGAGVTPAGFAAPAAPARSPSAPAKGARAPEASRASSAVQARARNLLDEELDPSEFPQTVPPPPPGAAEAEDGFELLVEDDDILDDDDTQVSYERE